MRSDQHLKNILIRISNISSASHSPKSTSRLSSTFDPQIRRRILPHQSPPKCHTPIWISGRRAIPPSPVLGAAPGCRPTRWMRRAAWSFGASGAFRYSGTSTLLVGPWFEQRWQGHSLLLRPALKPRAHIYSYGCKELSKSTGTNCSNLRKT